MAPDPLRAHLAASMAATSSEARSQNSSGSRAVNCGHDCGRRGRASGRGLGRGLIVSSSAGVEVWCRLVSSAGLHGMLLAAAHLGFLPVVATQQALRLHVCRLDEISVSYTRFRPDGRPTGCRIGKH